MNLSIKRITSIPRHRGQELLSYFFDLIKPASPSQVRVVIFAQGRTGSSLLESLLCSTGQFRRNGELLNTRKGEILFPVNFIRGLSKWKSANNFVFHVKIYQLIRDRKRRPIDPGLLIRSLYDEGWKIIYLRRKNKVKHVISNFVAKHRGAYHKFDDREERLKVAIDCKLFVEKLNERLLFEAEEKKALMGISYHEVVYEDDLESADKHQETINRIMDYLSLPHERISTQYKKINTAPLNGLVSNYDEFIDCINKHGLQRYIE
jgi:hypothetical protein